VEELLEQSVKATVHEYWGFLIRDSHEIDPNEDVPLVDEDVFWKEHHRFLDQPGVVA
jgi:hypothetical protein